MIDGPTTAALLFAFLIVFGLLAIAAVVILVAMMVAVRRHLYNRALPVIGGTLLVAGLIVQAVLPSATSVVIGWAIRCCALAGVIYLMSWIIIVAPQITPRRGP